MTTLTTEQLQTDNRTLRTELTRAQTEIHYTYKDILHQIHHRGIFANCPDPDCVRVRVLLGKEENNVQP
jgi:hypothetical protein